MIKRLRSKLILLSMVSLFALLLVLVTAMNLVNYNRVKTEGDQILELLSGNQGAFPELPHEHNGPPKDWMGDRFSPETPYEVRYFSVLCRRDGTVIFVETEKIAAVDGQTAAQYATQVLPRSASSGFFQIYRYRKVQEGENIRITFLDCSRDLAAARSFLLTSIVISLAGCLLVFAIIVFISGRIVRPIARSYEKQKRFITDAGHEIKTPLTIMRANIDLLEMENGPGECIEDLRQQAQRLTELTNDLVYLARMEEGEQSLTVVEFPLSDVVAEAVAAFQAPAQRQQLHLCSRICPLLSMQGDSKAVSQLCSVLLDNALKYSPTDGEIQVELERQGRYHRLLVENPSKYPLNEEQLSHIFDRFYRSDPSRNSETGGHGIGLSIAQAITAAHGGKICASAHEGNRFRITVFLPL